MKQISFLLILLFSWNSNSQDCNNYLLEDDISVPFELSKVEFNLKLNGTQLYLELSPVLLIKEQYSLLKNGSYIEFLTKTGKKTRIQITDKYHTKLGDIVQGRSSKYFYGNNILTDENITFISEEIITKVFFSGSQSYGKVKNDDLKLFKTILDCFKTAKIAKEQQFALIDLERLERLENERQLKKKQEQERREKELIELHQGFKNDSILEISTRVRASGFKEYYNKMFQENMELLKTIKNEGKLCVNEYEVISNNLDFIDIHVGIYNSFNDRIKYAQFNLIAFNPVNDRVGGLEKIKGVGFVEVGESATWEFDNVFYDKTISTVSIESVLLTFDNGSKKSLNRNNLVFSEILSQEEFLSYTQFGSVLLNEHQIDGKSYFSLEYYSLSDGEYKFVSLLSIGIEQLALNIEAAIESAKKGISGEFGLFRSVTLTDRIYFSGNELKGNILYINDAEKLLVSLKSKF